MLHNKIFHIGVERNGISLNNNVELNIELNSGIEIPCLHLLICYSLLNVDLFTCRSTRATVSMSKSAVFILGVVPW